MGGAPAHRRGAASTVRLGCVWRVPLAVVMRMALLGAVVLVVHASLIAPHHSGRSRHSILTPSSLRMISTNIGLSSSSSSSRRSETGKQRQRQSPLKSRALLPSAKGTQSSSLGIRSRATSFWQTGGGEPHSNDTKKTRVRPLQQQQADSNEENTNSAAATISSLATIPSTTTTTSNTGNNSPWEWVIRTLSQSFNFSRASPSGIRSHRDRHRVQLLTLLRVGIPSVGAGIVATLVFPALALALAGNFQNPGVFSVLSQDSSQFVQNFLTVAGLLFSILVGQTYYFLYTQQESIYYALFAEVTEAKSLLEQVALVCQGRSMYPRCLDSISRYVQNDLKQIQCDPAVLLSARPVDDPLESIMYLTSVGVPSTVYETVKSLREARARRLGALQRKLPSIHMWLLWILAAIELVSFPLLGAGTQTLGGYNLLTLEGILFGVMTGGIVLTLRVVGELWRPAGGAYNVDAVLSVMVSGLEEELKARMAGRTVNRTSGGVYSSAMAPSGASDDFKMHSSPPTIRQGIVEKL